MKSWYFAESNAQSGPHSQAEIQQKLNEKSITPDTLLWAEGMREWTPLRNLAEFSASPYIPPAAELGEIPIWDNYTPTGSQIRPWVRYWARSLDVGLFAVLVSLILALTFPELLEIPDIVFGIILAVAFIGVDAFLVSTFGTTPFKALLNVRIRDQRGLKPGFKPALRRAFSVWVQGIGMGIPIVTLFTNYAAYQRLSASGSTSWDTAGGFVVSHRKIEIWRLLVLVGLLAGFVALIALAVQAGEEL